MTNPAEALTYFGFNALESEVYAAVLHLGSVTGYRVAAEIGKPAANTYKALESLERKGAVVQDGSKKRVYTAIKPESLLGRLEKEFAKNSDQALKSLKSIANPAPTNRLVTLSSLDQALIFASEAIKNATETVALIASKDVFAALSAIPSKVECAGLTSAPNPPVGIDLVPEDAFETPTLELVVDHSKAIMFNQDQGFMVESHPLAMTLHQAVICQVGLYRIDRKLEEDASRKQLSRIIEALP